MPLSLTAHPQSDAAPSAVVPRTFTLPRLLLHAEGLALFVAAIVGYRALGGPWWLFAALLLAPDVFMIGYLRGPRLGALTYNVGHTTIVPLALLGLSLLAGWATLSLVSVIWLAHIGMDRAVGYGLKYATSFKDNHLGRV